MEYVAMFGGSYLVVFLLVYCIVLAYSAAAYVLQAISLSAVAKRRGIERPWLAWIPVANMWTLGCISDQYRYATQGIDRNFRKKLLWLMVVYEVLQIPYFALRTFEMTITESGLGNAFITVMIIAALVMVVISLAVTVLQYMAFYDYFRSCAADKAVLYLLLSLFVPFAQLILVFMVRNKDLGMPPKTETPTIE